MSKNSYKCAIISILVLGALALHTRTLSAEKSLLFPVEVFKRLLEDKVSYSEFVNAGKTVKAQKLWTTTEQYRAKHFKAGVWYTLPQGCVGKKGTVYDVELECKLPEIQGPDDDGTISEIPILFGLELLYDANRDRILEAIQEVGYDRFQLNFRVGAKSGFPSNGSTGYVHTSIDGLTVYINDLKILRRIPFQ